MNARVIKTGCQEKAFFGPSFSNNAIAIQEAATMLLRITAYQMDVAVIVDISDRPLLKKKRQRKKKTKGESKEKQVAKDVAHAPWM